MVSRTISATSSTKLWPKSLWMNPSWGIVAVAATAIVAAPSLLRSRHDLALDWVYPWHLDLPIVAVAHLFPHGFPARAGMVHPHGHVDNCVFGFPPARGWSRAARNAAKPKRGFPARAGMVPTRASP